MSEQQFNTIIQMIARLSDIVTAQGERIAAIGKELSSHTDTTNKRFSKVDARFDHVDARFDNLDARVDSIDARFDNLDARVDSIDARIDSLEVEMRAGFAKQLEVSQLILDTIGRAHQDLEIDHQTTKKLHNKRLIRLEKYAFGKNT